MFTKVTMKCAWNAGEMILRQIKSWILACIIALSPAAVMAEDWNQTQISLNYLTDTVAEEPLKYVEVETFGTQLGGKIDYYGFVDFNDDDTVFHKADLQWNLDESPFFLRTITTGLSGSDFSNRDYFAGAGIKLGSAIRVAALQRWSESDFDNFQTNGQRIAVNVFYPMTERMQFGGWADLDVNQQIGDTKTSYRHNLGVSYDLSKSVYTRVAWHFGKDSFGADANSENGAQFTIGLRL